MSSNSLLRFLPPTLRVWVSEWPKPSGQRPGGRKGIVAGRGDAGSAVNQSEIFRRGELMELGMIGLGRMGANMVRRLIKKGHHCVVFDRSPQAVADLVKEQGIWDI